MALYEVILEIALEMEGAAAKFEPESLAAWTLNSYAKQLRAATRAAGNSQPAPSVAVPAAAMIPELQNFLEVEKARKELREQRGKMQLEDQFDALAQCVDGPHAGDMVPVTKVPEGAFALVAGEVYQLQGAKLIHRPDHRHFTT